LLVPIWNEIGVSTPLVLLTRIHHPVFFAWALAEEAPTLTNAPSSAIANTEPIHCLDIFIWFLVLVILLPNEKSSAMIAFTPVPRQAIAIHVVERDIADFGCKPFYKVSKAAPGKSPGLIVRESLA
jgi:hypothetical protein